MERDDVDDFVETGVLALRATDEGNAEGNEVDESDRDEEDDEGEEFWVSIGAKGEGLKNGGGRAFENDDVDVDEEAAVAATLNTADE